MQSEQNYELEKNDGFVNWELLIYIIWESV